MAQEKIDCVRNAFRSRFHRLDSPASVMFHGRDKVPAVNPVWIPLFTLLHIFVYDEFCDRGGNGVLSWFNGPFSAVCDYIFWFRHYGCIIFNVVVDCSINMSHICNRKLVFTLHTPAIKCFFQVQIACSDELCMCICSGSS